MPEVLSDIGVLVCGHRLELVHLLVLVLARYLYDENLLFTERLGLSL